MTCRESSRDLKCLLYGTFAAVGKKGNVHRSNYFTKVCFHMNMMADNYGLEN